MQNVWSVGVNHRHVGCLARAIVGWCSSTTVVVDRPLLVTRNLLVATNILYIMIFTDVDGNPDVVDELGVREREEILELRSSIEEEIVYTCDRYFQLNKSSRNQKQSPKGWRKTGVLGIFEWWLTKNDLTHPLSMITAQGEDIPLLTADEKPIYDIMWANIAKYTVKALNTVWETSCKCNSGERVLKCAAFKKSRNRACKIAYSNPQS